MFKSILKSSPLNAISNMVIFLPSPTNISYLWNFGSMLSICLIIQIVSGLLLSMHYCPHTSIAFESIMSIMQNVNYGWLIRYTHLNTASFFFLCIFLHIGRNIYYNSFNLKKVWFSGIIIFFLSMTSAFLGYVLPWGQMSYWGATVITNLISSIPYFGPPAVIWVWGGFSIDSATLNRFFSLHFILPLLILGMTIIHLYLLHETGSSNPLGSSSNLSKLMFHPFFTSKDLISIIILITSILLIVLIKPNTLNDPENFIKANPMITPFHIQPEWYFLFAYAILRSISNKLGGVIALLMSICILFILPFISVNQFKTLMFYPCHQILFWSFVNIFILLTWLGMKEIKYPFYLLSQVVSLLYFTFFIINPFMYYKWEKIISWLPL